MSTIFGTIAGDPVIVHFDGSDYSAELDQVRLTGQMKAVFDLMKDGEWRTLAEIETATFAPQSSISAQLRNLRKQRFGGYVVEKRRVTRFTGLFEYRLCIQEK